MNKKYQPQDMSKLANNKAMMISKIKESIDSIWEALVELITNCDSAYAMAYQKEDGYQGEVRIELIRGGISNPTILRVKDKAIGMSSKDIEEKLNKYMKVTSNTARSMFGKGFKDNLALGDIKVQSVKKDEKGKLRYSEYEYTGVWSKNPIMMTPIQKDELINDEILKKLGTTKAKVGHVVEISIPPIAGDRFKIPQADIIRERLANHYALSRLMDKEKGNLKVFFVNGKDKPDTLTYVRPEAKLVFDDKTVFKVNDPEYPDGVEATFKLWRFDEPFENDIADSRFKRLGISVYGEKGCHDKTFFDKKIENDEYRKRYFGDLQCPYIQKLAREFNENYNNEKPLRPDNDRMIIDNTRQHGIKADHPFIANHLFPWAIDILKKFIDEDKKRDEKEKGKKDEKLDKYMKELMKDFSKEMEVDDEEEDTDFNDIGDKIWKVIFTNRELVIGETARIYVATNKRNLKAGFDTIELKSDKPNEILSIDSESQKLQPMQNKKDYVRAQFHIQALKEGEQIFKIHHAGNIKTEFKVKVIAFRNKDLSNIIEFENNSYTVTYGKNRQLKVFAKVPEALTENKNLNISIVDDSVVRYKGPSELKVVEGSNYAEAKVHLNGLKLNGSTRIMASFQDNFAETIVKVNEKDDSQDKPTYTHEFTEQRLGGKRAQWKGNILLITTSHDVIKKFLGSTKAPYPNSGNPAWITMLWEILCDKFAEKKVLQMARKKPLDYTDLLKSNDIDFIINQSQAIFENEKAKWIEKFMSKLPAKVRDLGRDE